MTILPKLKLLIALLLITIMTGCTYGDRIEKEERQVPWPEDEDQDRINFTLYFPTMSNEKEKIGQEDRLVPALEIMGTTVMQQLLLGPYRQGTQTFLFPKDTRLLSLDVQDGISYVNLNQNIFEDSSRGIDDHIIIYCIVYSLTEIQGIDRVQILVEGKAVSADDFDLSAPLSRENITKP